MIGPCMCGDPGCGSCFPCGDVGLDVAYEGMCEALDDIGATSDEIELAMKVAVTAIIAQRDIDKRVREQLEAEQKFLESVDDRFK